MTIKLVSREEEGELLLVGRLDTITSAEAEPIFTECSQRFERLILNMARLDYVSSAGLRVIKNLNFAMQKKGGELVLTNVSRMVMGVFEMTGFVNILHFE